MKELTAAGRDAVALEQERSFSSEYATVVGEGDTAFFPGCSAMAHDAELVLSVWRYLRTLYPGLALCTYCCGGHSMYLDLSLYLPRRQQLAQALADRGIIRLIVCCPNCQRLLATMPGLEIVPVWRVLAEHPPQPRPVPADSPRWLLHDPCPARLDRESQDNVRRLLAVAGLPYDEYAQNREHTICCGRKHLLELRDPAAAARLSQMALERAPGRHLVCWCFSCCRVFREAGCICLHPWELFFGEGPIAPAPSRTAEEGWQQRRLLLETAARL